MATDKTIRWAHLPLTVLILVFSVITMSLAASLVHHFQTGGRSYPPGGYKARIRELLAASVITLTFTIFLGVGVLMAVSSALFGILPHIILYFISFSLYLGGVASLTRLTSTFVCRDVTWSRCNIVKGLVANSWIQTILLFVIIFWVFFAGLKRNRGGGLTGGLTGNE